MSNQGWLKLSEMVDQKATLGDKRRLEAVSVMVARMMKFSTKQKAVNDGSSTSGERIRSGIR